MFLDIAILAFSIEDNLTDHFLLDGDIYYYIMCRRNVFIIYYKVSADNII